jgi:hypothetical protein
VGQSDPRIINADVTDDSIIAYLADGRVISVPLVWSWRLAEATTEQRANHEIVDDGVDSLARNRRKY